jgi:hypothetical protein
MINDSRKNLFDFIITKEISLFSRNTLDSIKYTQELLESGVGVLFQTDNINTLMPDAELRLTIMASLAQDELRRLSERVKFGHRQAIGKGVVLGNNKIWGYTKKDGKLVVNEKEAEIVRHIFDIYVTGKGMRLVCAWLIENGYRNQMGNEFTPSTIKGVLRNPKYKGYYCGNKYNKVDYRHKQAKALDESEWVLYKNEETVPPIVTEEIWQRANDILETRSKKMALPDKSVHSNRYAYSSKIICAKHGVPFYRDMLKYKSGPKEIWRCREYTIKGTKGCTLPMVYTTELDAIVTDVYNSVISEKTEIISKTIALYDEVSKNSTVGADILRIKVEMDSIAAKKDKLLDLIMKELISDDDFKQRNSSLDKEHKRLAVRLSELEAADRKNQNMCDMVKSLQEAIETELEFKEGFSSYIVDYFIDRIIVHNTENKKIIKLSVYLKVVDKEHEYTVDRSSGESSILLHNTEIIGEDTILVTCDFPVRGKKHGFIKSFIK